MRTVTREEVEAAFNAGGYTINERFEECGFIYFPTGTRKHLQGAAGRDHDDQGRVFWNVEKHEYPDTFDGRQEAQIDKALGTCYDKVDISPGWGRTTDKQQTEIETLITLYTLYRRQARAQVVA